MTLDQEWQGEYFSAAIHEAVFNGMNMTFAMSISPVDGADPVYVIPRIRASVNGQALHTWVMDGNVELSDDGFWVPSIIPDHRYDYTNMALDVGLSDDGWSYAPIAEAIEWEISFDVLHTDWPILFTQEDEPGEEPLWIDEQWKTYEQQFYDAYANKQVLLNRAGMFSYWGANAVESQEDESYADYCQRLLTKEAFTLMERATFRFGTAGQSIRTAKEAVRFTTEDGFDVELTDLKASSSQVELAFRITRFEDESSQILYEQWKSDFVVMAENAKTDFVAACLQQQEDGSLEYDMHVLLEGETDKLLLLPVYAAFETVPIETTEGITQYAKDRALMKKLLPMTPEQRRSVIEIELQ